MIEKNKILIGCLSLLLVLSVGYALFSETVTINGTATAKGSFDIEGTCEVITETNAASASRYTRGGTGNCEIENGVIKTTSTLSKPGDSVYYRVYLKNTGTIPAVLKTVDSSNNVNEYLNDVGDVAYYDSTYYLVGGYFFENHEDDGAISDSGAEALKITLEPNQIEPIVVAHEWIDAVNLGKEQTVVPEDGAVMNYNIELGFEQVAN